MKELEDKYLKKTNT